jgi:hypothetical protein
MRFIQPCEHICFEVLHEVLPNGGEGGGLKLTVVHPTQTIPSSSSSISGETSDTGDSDMS